MTARKDIFGDPSVCRFGLVINRNAVDHGHAAGSQKARYHLEIGGHGRRADMFQPLDRYDLVELATLVATVAEG